MKNHFVVCVCETPEHTLRFMYDEEEKELYTEVYLNQYRSFFKRVWVAVKYVFGYTSKYGHWDCTIISKPKADKLKAFLNNME